MPKARLSKKEKKELNDKEKLVLFWRLHPVRAVKDILNVDLIWFQRIMIRIMFICPYVFSLLGRGCGKTYMWAVFASVYAILYPGVAISYINPTMGQSYQFWSYIREFYDNAHIFKRCCKKGRKEDHAIKDTKSRIFVFFKNGSKIETVAVKQGQQSQKIRGFRYQVVIMDEFKDYDPEIIPTVIMPWMTVSKLGMRNKLLTSTTGFFSWNHAYYKKIQYMLNYELGNREYRVFEYDFRDVNIVDHPQFKMEEQMITQIKNEVSMTEELFNMEMFCYIPEESDKFISMKLLNSPKVTSREPFDVQIHDHTQKTSEGFISKYVMGIDIANVPKGDNYALQVIRLVPELGGGELVYSFAANGWTTDQITYNIFEKIRDFNIVRMFIDKSGSGQAVVTNLKEGFPQMGVPKIFDMNNKNDDIIYKRDGGLMILKCGVFTVPGNTNRFDLTKSSLEHGRLKFPYAVRKYDPERHLTPKVVDISLEINKTKTELTNLTPEPVAHGEGYKYTVPHYIKKDRAVSLGLAVEAMYDYYNIETVNKKREFAVGKTIPSRWS